MMKTKELKRSRNKITDWNEHLDKKYGKVGTITRTEFEGKAQAFVIGELFNSPPRHKVTKFHKEF